MADVFLNIAKAPPQRRISEELAAALKAEARRRAERNAFFGYMAYASMVGRKPK